jgi:serine/threonine protein kinase/tetratricopeptide (TPR) repeat protein
MSDQPMQPINPSKRPADAGDGSGSDETIALPGSISPDSAAEVPGDQTLALPDISRLPSDQARTVADTAEASRSEKSAPDLGQTCFVPQDTSQAGAQTGVDPNAGKDGSSRTKMPGGLTVAGAGLDPSVETLEDAASREDQKASHSSPTINLEDLSGAEIKAPGFAETLLGKSGSLQVSGAASFGDGTFQEPAPVLPGYEILQELGRGAMGVVYKARQKALNRIVALKMVLSGQYAGAKMRMRFQLEAEAVARLHHPNIVQIYEIGEQNGSPFFALEYVEGGTLSDRIDGREVPPREAAWVVQQLALAMDSAHRCGVIHRDLKPANILLQKDEGGRMPRKDEGGRMKDEKKAVSVSSFILPPSSFVPKITDFGLAKRLEDSSQTQAGSIMGTPSYMAPEQAEGRNDIVGPPADIYALGAILYDLLTGRPPFQGKTVLDTLQQVKKVDPIPPRRLCPRLARDLDTICLKCLEKAPERRYSSCQELAEDLRRFLAGEPILARKTPTWERTWKYAKRRPATAGVVGLTCALLLGLGVGGYVYADVEHRRAEQETSLRQEAETQRSLAQKHFKEAQNAVDFMLTRIGQERLEHEPRMEQVRRDLLEKALAFYEDFSKEYTDDPKLRAQTAQAYKMVGDIRHLLGKSELAEQSYESALGLLRPLVDTYPEDQQYRLDLAATYSNLGNLLSESARNDAALKAHEEARRLHETLVNATTIQMERGKTIRSELAKCFHNLAQVKKQNREGAEAIALLKEGLAIQEQLCRIATNNAVYARDLGAMLVSLGQLYRDKGEASEAEKTFRLSMGMLKELVSQRQAIPEDRQALARVHTRLAELFEAGKADKAEMEYREAVKLGAGLTEDFPTIPEYRQNLAASYNGLGVTLLAEGRRDDADAALQQGLKIKEKLAQDFPKRLEYRRDLANGLSNQGALMLTHQRPAESEAAYRRAAIALEELAKRPDALPDYQQDWGKALVNLASVLQLRSQKKEAEEAYLEALSGYQRLVEKYDQVPAYRFEWARAELLLATLRQRMEDRQSPGELAETEKLFRAAQAKLKLLVGLNAAEVDYRFELASVLSNLGDLLRAMNRADEGMGLWNEGLTILEALLREHPGRPIYVAAKARLLHNLGVVLSLQNKLPDAEKSHRNALSLRERLVAEFGKEPAYYIELASSHGELAIVLARRNRLTPSVESFQQAIAVLHKAMETLSNRPDFLKAELIHQTNLVNLLKAIGPAQEEKKCQDRIDAINRLLAGKK